MLRSLRLPVLSAALSITCTGALFLACNGGGVDTGAGGAGGGSAGSSEGGGGEGGLGLGGEDPNGNKLTIEPASATITITDKAVPAMQAFGALLDGNPLPDAAWSLDDYVIGTIDTTGLFTTTGMVGGKVKVMATYGDQTATADLTVFVQISEDVFGGPGDPGVSPPNETALDGPPQPDPGLLEDPPNASKILYPYDQTVMPRGLIAPLLQFSPGNLPPEDAKVVMSSDYFSWAGYFHVANGGVPQIAVPQDVWDAAMQSSGGQTLVIDVIKAAAGAAYGPAKTSIIVAPASLKGAVYYMTYEVPANGLYSVRPGVKEPATLLIPGCVVCHSVSANGIRLATGADDAAFAAQSGIYNVGADGSATQITGSPAGLGGDSRGISFATFMPDGKYVMRSQNNFWGGVNQLAWRIDDTNNQLVPANVVGLGPDVSALLPTIAPDGKRYAFTNGPGEPSLFGTPSRSLSVMDLAVDEASNTLTFSNRQLVLDNGAAGAATKFAAFLPDSDLIVLQEGENYLTSYDQMLPTWGPNSNFDTATGRLHMVKLPGQEHIELLNLNKGNADIDRQRNYEPFALPVAVGGYYWIVFTSIRDYGNTFTGPGARKQLWVAAISPTSGPGEDPSHPPFYLPNQSATRNERGFWALEPCKPMGDSCEGGDECCDGYCHPSDPDDPSSPKVCQPTADGCSQLSEKCETTGDCCDAPAGVECIGGFCTQNVPQ